MPTYEYECDSCGKQFEYFQSISEAAKTTCEACGGALTKLLSPGGGLIFKGSGFYITDYKNKGAGESKSSSSSSSESKSSTESKSESKKSDSKPAEGGSTPASTTSNSTKSE
jgi:putative FmdB family regulatory protein